MTVDTPRCVFCDAPDVTARQRSTGQWSLRCGACGAEGPVAPDPQGALETWTQARYGHELLRTVIDESPDIILMKDWDGRFLIGNRALARLYGTTPEALVGVDDGAFNPNEEQVAFYLENVRSVMRSDETEIVMESSTDVETGETRHFQSIKKPLRGPDGEPRILVIAHDVTDLQRAHQVIEERERSYAYAMSAAGDGIWDWDIQHDTVTHNAKWGELFGFGTEQLTHPVDVFASLLHPEDRVRVEAALKAALDGGDAYESEHRMVTRDGRVMHVSDRGRVVERDAAGQPLRMAGAVRDIGDQVRAEQRLRAMTEALADANVLLERKVEQRTKELEAVNEELRTLALRDALTGLPNRLSGMERLEEEYARLSRNDGTSALLMMDIDLFKAINDTHGHPLGDAVLRHVAAVVRSSLRTGDFVARFGGEEFMALLPDTDLAGALVVADKVRESVAAAAHEQIGQVTLSIGVTATSVADPDMDIAIRRADSALYEAKRSGRNRVVLRGPHPVAASVG